MTACLHPQGLNGGAGVGGARGASACSCASSVVAEATEASALDSLHDGVSSVDEGSTDGRQHRQGTLELW